LETRLSPRLRPSEKSLEKSTTNREGGERTFVYAAKEKGVEKRKQEESETKVARLESKALGLRERRLLVLSIKKSKGG